MAAAHLSSSVYALRSSLDKLNSSIRTLDAGVNDFPRLSRVLARTRHFELTSESQLAGAQAALVAEIQPEVENLLGRVDEYLKKLELTEHTLSSRHRLQSNRLKAARENANSRAQAGGPSRRKPQPSPDLALRMRQLQQQKERLSYAVEKLELQANQHKIKQRMSIAPSFQRDWE